MLASKFSLRSGAPVASSFFLSKSRLLSSTTAAKKSGSNFIIPGDLSAFTKIESSTGKKIYYFTATWCPPCRFIGPKFEALAAEAPTVSFVKIDLDNFEQTASKYKINSVPTFIFADGSKILSQFSGADESQLKRCIEMLNNSN